jgi:hypothetical protein
LLDAAESMITGATLVAVLDWWHGGKPMLTIAAALLLVTPPPNFTVVMARDTVKIDKVVWYDAQGERHLTEKPYLQIRLTVRNDADHPVRWPGFHRARVTYGTRYVGGAVLTVSFGPGSRWENSLVTDQVVNPRQRTTILLVFDVPRILGAPASLEVQWKGESAGWNMTVKTGFRLPAGKPDVDPGAKARNAKDGVAPSNSRPGTKGGQARKRSDSDT